MDDAPATPCRTNDETGQHQGRAVGGEADPDSCPHSPARAKQNRCSCVNCVQHRSRATTMAASKVAAMGLGCPHLSDKTSEEHLRVQQKSQTETERATTKCDNPLVVSINIVLECRKGLQRVWTTQSPYAAYRAGKAASLCRPLARSTTF